MRFTLIALMLLALLVPAAQARSSRTTALTHAIRQYRHANGYIKAIGHVARRTIYHPNPRIRRKWERALHWLMKIRTRARQTIFVLKTPPHPPNDWAEFSCIHSHEGATNSNTGNGFYGGLQEDIGFQRTYGPEFLARWGTADRWPIWAQVTAARRARDGYGGYEARGYSPWPNTARACGLL